MVLDTSALLAMLLAEPERDAFITLLSSVADPLVSAATLLEASIAMQAKTGTAGVRDLNQLLITAGVRCIAVDDQQARPARDGFARYGKGRSPTSLNFGDCFSYAFTRAAGRPLLFKGDDFSKTDVTPALTHDPR